MIPQETRTGDTNGGQSDILSQNMRFSLPDVASSVEIVSQVDAREAEPDSSGRFIIYKTNEVSAYSAPTSHIGTLTEAYENAVNIAYRDKSKVIPPERTLHIARDELSAWYIFTYEEEGFDPNSKEFQNGGLIVRDAQERRSIILGGLIVKKPIDTQTYIEEFVTTSTESLSLLEGQIQEKYGTLIPAEILAELSVANIPFIELSRAINISGDRSILKDIPPDILMHILKGRSLLRDMKQSLFCDAIDTSKRTIHAHDTSLGNPLRAGIVGAVGFRQGGPDALMNLFTRQTHIITDAVQEVEFEEDIAFLKGFYPDMRKKIQPEDLIRLQYSTQSRYRNLFTDGFYNTYNGPHGAGTNPLVLAGAFYLQPECVPEYTPAA